jgi:hypothetical protein
MNIHTGFSYISQNRDGKYSMIQMYCFADEYGNTSIDDKIAKYYKVNVEEMQTLFVNTYNAILVEDHVYGWFKGWNEHKYNSFFYSIEDIKKVQEWFSSFLVMEKLQESK